MKVSVVITTYNRRNLVARALESAFHWRAGDPEVEVVVVDDASTDGTVDFISQNFADELAAGWLRLEPLAVNLGAAGAKNAGVAAARGDWVIILDSDDEFSDGAREVIMSELEGDTRADAFFFRCADRDTGELVGRTQPYERMTARALMRDGFPGEAMPVVSRPLMLRFPFPTELRGCESIAFKNMALADADLWHVPRIARVYDQAPTGRLSRGVGRSSRYGHIARYHLWHVRNWRHGGVRLLLASAAKATLYRLGALLR